MRVVAILFCVAGAAAPAQLSAQTLAVSDWPIAAGSRVRIVSPVFGKRAVTGNVVSATSDTLVFRAVKDSVSRSIPTPNIAKIEVATGTHTRKLGGALLGLFIGAGAGAIVGATSYSPSKCTDFCIDFGRGFDAAVAGTLGAVAGTVVGLIAGSRERDTWVPVGVPPR
jgi:hypothetical protein